MSLVQEFKDYAIAHYNEGWDYVVECWDSKRIAEEIEGATNLKEAIDKVAWWVELVAERQAEHDMEANLGR